MKSAEAIPGAISMEVARVRSLLTGGHRFAAGILRRAIVTMILSGFSVSSSRRIRPIRRIGRCVKERRQASTSSTQFRARVGRALPVCTGYLCGTARNSGATRPGAGILGTSARVRAFARDAGRSFGNSISSIRYPLADSFQYAGGPAERKWTMSA